MEREQVEVMDLYLAAYCLVRGCRIEEVKCIRTERKATCSLMIGGEGRVLRTAMEEFFTSTAQVNLLEFRHAYNQVNGAMHQAKRSYEETRQLGGSHG